MTAALEQHYRYRRSSHMDSVGGVCLATSGGPAAHPYFFEGFAERAEQTAVALLAVARVARTRFYVPPGMVAARIAAADPVVTSDGERLRFESFSVCCGVYARLDVLPAGLAGLVTGIGTTNVDVNPPLRAALARVAGFEPLHLAVGEDELAVSTLDGTVVERRVPLPERWLRGFAEVQLAAARMAPLHELPAVQARRFIEALPRGNGVLWAVPAVRGLRLTTRPAAGAVCVSGGDRLRVLAPLLRFATGLRVYGPATPAGARGVPSAWQLNLPDARLTVVLSAEPSRGLSGEGGVLFELAAADRDAQLAAAGRRGYDLADGGHFTRELPFDLTALTDMHPRLRDAEQLIAAGGVRFDGELAYVRSGGVEYAVRGEACLCPWWGKYQGARGPCKHVLAAWLARP